MDHPKDGGFLVACEPPEIFWNAEIDVDLAAVGEALDVLAKRGRETDFTEQGRMEQVRYRPDFLPEFV